MYPANFLRLVASGPLFGGVEQFSFSLSLGRDFDSDAEAPEEVPQAVIDAVTTFFQAPGVIGNRASLDLIKLNEIGRDGRYVSQSETVLAEISPPVVPSTSSPHAPQVALAISLMTSAARGRASRGRFYIPTPAVVVGDDARISSANAETVAAAATEFITDLNAAMPGWRVGVFSNIGDGQWRPVTRVRVGRVLDTIRSRRASIDEAPVSGTDIPPG